MTDVERQYRERYELLCVIASNLQSLITSYVEGIPNIDRIGARAKDPLRFVRKAEKKDENGNPKYQAPFTQIQDQIGARIVVFYREDVDRVSDVITRYFQHIEQKDMVPESQWAFGYFGHHRILALPKDVIPSTVDLSQVPDFFELQIKTLFQHAWSEAEHDLGYKAKQALSDDHKRRFAYTAAQAWGADRVFDELRQELT